MEQRFPNGWSSRRRLERKIRGIMATYIEACAFPGSGTGFCRIERRRHGDAEDRHPDQRAGHATAYAQFLSEKAHLDIDKIHVRQGDTDELKVAAARAARARSRSAAFSASRAGEDLADRSSAMPLTTGSLGRRHRTLRRLARIVGTDRTIDFRRSPRRRKPGRSQRGFGEFIQDECTYPNGTHICEVEIDPDTGTTQIVRYTIVDDFGVTVNPILLAGQVHGGVVQGIGQALTEDTIYGEDGQLLTASFMDYAMPRADDFPFFHFETRNVPSTTNALGIKGAGEAGTIGSTPAALNAVTDALWRAYGIRHIDMPATPARIWGAIREVTGG
jgi:carbon-monoxide dehydrogenase large subunit